jgi:proteic killer suppression protein
MIRSVRNAITEQLLADKVGKGFPADLVKAAQRKRAMVDAAKALEVLRFPPGNHLEPLKGNRRGQHSIRINDQWRVCFVWRGGHAYDVEVCDYH